jgi:hypothetical protein
MSMSRFLRFLRFLRRPGGLAAAVLLAGGAAAVAAGPATTAQTWTPIGPNGGSLRVIAQAPGAPDVLYAVSSGGGIFASFDHARHWQLASDQLDSQFVEDLVVDPHDASVLYAALASSGIWKSGDRGATWSAGAASCGHAGTRCKSESDAGLPPGNPHVVLSLAIDPVDSRVVYAGTGGGVYRSTDEGATWAAAGADRMGAQEIFVVAVDAAHPGTVYAGCAGFFKSTDFGVTWTRKDRGLPGGLIAVVDVVAAPSSATLYASIGNQVFRSDDGGDSWTAGAGGSEDHLAVAANGWLFGMNSLHISRSTDRGMTWVTTPFLPPPDLEHGRALIAEATPAGAVFAATSAGLLASYNDGASWLPSSRGLTATLIDAVATAARAPSTLYASVGGLGVEKQAGGTGGTGWHQLNGSLPPAQLEAGTALAIDPGHPATLWRGTAFGVARSDDGGFTWIDRTPPDDCMIVWSIAVDPRRSDTVYVGATEYQNSCDRRDSHSWKSADGGRDWLGLPVSSLSIVIDPLHPAILYSVGFVIYRSLDGGASWQDATAGLGGAGVNALAIDPANPPTLYAATTLGVFKSGNRGRTWRAARSGLPRGNVLGVAVGSGQPATVYAAIASTGGADGAGAGGVFVSTDGAASWRPLGSGLPSRRLSGLAIDAARPDVLYALTQGYGLYRLVGAAPEP